MINLRAFYFKEQMTSFNGLILYLQTVLFLLGTEIKKKKYIVE